MKYEVFTNTLKNKITMSKKIILVVSLFLVSLVSCRDKTDSADYKAKEGGFEFLKTSEEEPAPPPPGLNESVNYTSPAVSDKAAKGTASGSGFSVSDGLISNTVPVSNPVKIAEKIKKTANIDISVDDYKVARTAIEKIVKSGNGYIGGENEQNSTYSISNSMTIRVSNKDFDAMVGNLSSVASHVNSKNIYMEDVTAQFVDITARLKTKKEVEKRYLDLLQKAVKVSDIIEVEEQLRVIREEIEAKEGELKYLNDQVDYSTIILSLHQNFEYAPEETPGFFGRMGHAFGNGWNGFLSFLIGIVYTWPVWLILGVLTYFLFKFIKRQMKKK